MIKTKILKSKIRNWFILSENRARLALLHPNARIALVSCNKWKNKVYDDILLQKAFLDFGIGADIVSWQDETLDYSKYDALLITSMWGYQNFIEDLEKWLSKIAGAKLLNCEEIIRNNYDKVKQIKRLRKVKLPITPTTIIDKGILGKPGESMPTDIDKYFSEFPVVVKPNISSGGENTFLLRNRSDLKIILEKLQTINIKREILVQPFLEEIENGEISVVAIDKKIINAVIRFPGVIDKSGGYKVKPIAISDLDKNIIELCNRVIESEDQRQLYIRIDIVVQKNAITIMEVELFEPQLFYYLLKNEKRKIMLNTMVKAVEKRLSENSI